MILYFMFIGLPIIYLLYKIGVFGYVIKGNNNKYLCIIYFLNIFKILLYIKKLKLFFYLLLALYWIFVTFIGYNILFAMIGY